MKEFDLEEYLNNGVRSIIRGMTRAAVSDPGSAVFMTGLAVRSRRAAAKRAEAKAEGGHVPAFLIASITDSCNLHCKGCYARAFGSRVKVEEAEMSAGEWDRIFHEAAQMGVSFMLLAGGEPLMRKDVIEAAAGVKDIVFPVFTNGAMLDDEYMRIFTENRNMIPVISVEGGRETTDARRGCGVYDRIVGGMEACADRNIIFGASVTVNRNNMDEVLSRGFVEDMRARGCKSIVYVEYVPADRSSIELALDDRMRGTMMRRMNMLREEFDNNGGDAIMLIAFPGDERKSGGCLAAGRGFFHINPRGGVEPCPFSPYSDTNLRDASLRDALGSPLFKGLGQGILNKEHMGGCVLFEHEDEVRGLMEEA